LRLLTAQRLVLRRGKLLLATAVLAAGVLVMVELYRWVEMGNLAALLRQFHERFLPLWALVAAAQVWADLDPLHRPLVLAWPAAGGRLAAAKALAVLLPYLVLAALSTWSLPHLWEWAMDVRLSAAERAALFPIGTMMARAMAVGLFYVGIVSALGAVGVRWAGFTLGGALWLVNSIDSWLAGVAGGAFHLFAWSRGPVADLGVATAGTALAGLAGVLAAQWLLERRRGLALSPGTG